MKGRIPHLVILGGSLTFLVSLYFGWTERTVAAPCNFQGFECGMFGNGSQSFDGWRSFGQGAAVLALALAAGAIAAMVKPRLADRLPLGMTAFALLVFALLSGAELWESAVSFAQYGPENSTVGLAPGGYLGLVCAGVVCAAAAAAWRTELTPPPTVTGAAGLALTLGLFASFFVPTFHVHPFRAGSPLLLTSSGVLICAVACLGLPAWSHRGRPGLRLAVAAAVATLVAGLFVPYRSYYREWPFELWLLFGCTAGLLLLALAGIRGVQLRRLSLTEGATVAAGVVFLVSLFLPWGSHCVLRAQAEGSCTNYPGWPPGGGLAGTFVLILLVAVLCFGRFLAEFALGAAIYVLAAGVTLTEPGQHLRYGAPLGFAAAAVLFFFGLRRLRPIPGGRRYLIRLVPAIAALALLTFEAAAMMGRDNLLEVQSPWRFLHLLEAAAILVTLRVLLRWFDRPRDFSEIVLLPVALLALTALDLVYTGTTLYSDSGISWEGWVSVLLCLVLIVCGWIERYGGGLRIPEEIWRIDRISAVED